LLRSLFEMPHYTYLFAVLAASSLALLFAAEEKAVGKLGTYSISDVTVSGISAGGYMAVQVHVAFSSLVNGSAIFAGGPYYCAKGNLIYAEDQCMATYMGTPDVTTFLKYTDNQVEARTIDDTDNMKDDKIYIFSGKADSVVDPAVVEVLQTYYSHYVDVSNMVMDYNIDAQHCLPTLNYGEACATLKSPYIGKCNFDGARFALETLYGDLTSGTAVDANLMSFSQTPYFTNQKASIGDVGYIYVPTACASGQTSCHLHVSFHGCKQYIDAIGDQYAADTGFNRWAEANNIIVLYPYVVTSTYPSNPNGCWDWWAYTGADYALKSGVQMQFVKALIDQVSGTKTA